MFQALLFALSVAVVIVAGSEMMSVNLNIDGVEYGVKFPSSLSASTVATQFCVEQAGNLGIVQETLPNCISPVERFLQSAITDERRRSSVEAIDQRNIQVKLKVNEIDFEITFRPSAVTIEEVANAFCTDKGNELGVTDATYAGCVDEINKYLLRELVDYVESQTPKAASAASQDKPMRLPMRVGDRDYTVEFVPQRVTAQEIATQFCIEQGASLGFTNESIQECIAPIASYLSSAIQMNSSAPKTPVSAATERQFQVFNYSH
jgi:hypothetical protein